LSSVSIKDARMKADGPRLDGAATSAGMEEGRAGRALHLCRRRVVGGTRILLPTAVDVSAAFPGTYAPGD
jgi:hypothetical protein